MGEFKKFYLANGVRLDWDGAAKTLAIVRINPDEPDGQPAEVLVEGIDLAALASVMSTISPWEESGGSFDYAHDFLRDGVMYCGGCGAKITTATNGGRLPIVQMPVCRTCYEQKFKPLFDWALERKR